MYWQICVTFANALLSLFFSGTKGALSAMLGGLVCMLPNAYFAIKLFQYHGANAAKKIMTGFYRGEVMKILLTALLFSMTFWLVKIVPVVFFSAFIVAQMMFWFAPLIFENKQNRPESD